MINKIICLAMLAGILLFAGSVADADRPTQGYVTMKSGYMSWKDLGMSLPDTSVASDTLFSKWVDDPGSKVSPWVVSVNINVDQIGTNTYTGKLYMVYANDTTDIFLVDSALTGAGVATFDTTYSELLTGYRYYRWYWIATDSNYIADFGVKWSGYR